jgi:MFS transporter, ACS family, hexuronate transporter
MRDGSGVDRVGVGRGATVDSSVADWLAAAAHQGWSCNLFTLASDMKRAVASVVGLGRFAGAVGGMLIADGVGHILQWTHSYVWPFVIAGSAYLIALLALYLLASHLDPVQIDASA